MHRLATDPALAQHLVATGFARASQFDLMATGARFLAALREALPLPDAPAPTTDPSGSHG